MSDVAVVRQGLAQTLQANVAGLSARNVFQYAPDQPADAAPFGFFQLRRGTILTPRLDVRETTHRLFFVLCFSLQSGLGDAEKNAEPFVQRVVAAVDLHKTLGSAANVYDASVVEYEQIPIRLRPGPQEPEYYGLRFTVEVNELEQGALYAA